MFTACARVFGWVWGKRCKEICVDGDVALLLNIRKHTLFLYIYAMTRLCFQWKNGAFDMFFHFDEASKNCAFDKRKTALQRLLDAIMMLTFFDAVAIAIATCSYRDDNMMLST